MIQAQLNAYGPKTTFVGRHPYEQPPEDKSGISGLELVQIVKDNPGITCIGIFNLLGRSSTSNINGGLRARVKYGDVHIRKVNTPHPSGKGGTKVIHWYPGAGDD